MAMFDSLSAKAPIVMELASGAPLLVDAERGRGRTLFALSQGVFPCDTPGCAPAGAAANEDTGALLRVKGDGTFAIVEDGLNLPTSVEIINNSAYVVTLPVVPGSMSGTILKIDDIAGPPYGISR
jgi:hypothetical protein